MLVLPNRRVAAAGFTYVGAWLAGLFVAPPAPDMDAPPAQIAAHYAEHGAATALQSLLIHGVAGVALIVLALSLSTRRPVRAAGIAAGAVSLFQAVVGLALSIGADPAWFDFLNLADTVKLAFVGAFIWLAARDLTPGLARAGRLVAPLQGVAGAAFATGSAALFSLLYIALPVLLLWVAAVAYRAVRPGRADGSERLQTLAADRGL
jgi:hypothetical protein